MIVLSHPPDEQQDTMVKFCKTQVRYAGQKVKNQKNKDTFRRSIGEKICREISYLTTILNVLSDIWCLHVL